MVELSGNILSPGGADKNRFTTSLGLGVTIINRINWDTQLLVTGTSTNMKTDPYYWLPFDPADTSVSLSNIDVSGSIQTLGLEARRLFPSDRQNYLYLGLGVDFFNFGEISASWMEQQAGTTQSPQPHSITTKRDPSWAAGVHVSPGLFFLVYPKISVDISIRVHALYDGKHTIGWLEPNFGMGLKYSNPSPGSYSKRAPREAPFYLSVNVFPMTDSQNNQFILIQIEYDSIFTYSESISSNFWINQLTSML